MEVNLYYSNTFRGSFDALTKSLKANLRYDNIVIVPDRFTLTIEKAVLDKLDIQGSMNIEVMSFSRLAFYILGNNINKCLTPESAVMLLSRVIRASYSELKCYNKVKDITAFSKDMYAAISALRNSGVSHEALRQSLPEIKNRSIRQKTEDIILLYERYLNTLARDYNDYTTRLIHLTREIRNSERISLSNIYITDFYSFTEVEYGIIEELVKYARRVNIALIKPPEGSMNTRLYPHYGIERMASRLNAKVNIENYSYKLNAVNSIIERALFSYGGRGLCDPKEQIRLYQADDIKNEISLCAVKINSLIRKRRLRYKDIAIVCGDIEAYTPYIESIMKRYDIPVFIDKRMSIDSHPLIKYIYLILDYVSEGYPVNVALELSKNIFCKVMRDDSDEFENYVLKYRIKGRQILTPFMLGNYETAEKVRAAIVRQADLINVSDDSVNCYIENIKRLLKAIDADDTLFNLVKTQHNLEDGIHAEISRQIGIRLDEIFNDINEILGSERISLAEFITLLKANISAVKISMIPQYIDCVVVGEPVESRYARIIALFVLGANDGVMPFNHKDSGIITSNECSEWKLDMFPTAKQSMLLEKLYLKQLLIKPEELTVLSFSSRSESGEYLNPSVVIKDFKTIFNLEILPSTSIYKESYDIGDEERAEMYAEKFSTYGNSAFELVSALRLYKETKLSEYSLRPYDALFNLMDLKTQQLIKEINSLHLEDSKYISLGGEIFFSRSHTHVSQLECYFQCPLMHYLKYGLKARPREIKVLEAVDLGNIIHYALELLIKRIMDKYGNNYDIKDSFLVKEIDDVSEKAIDEAELILDQTSVKLLKDKIKRAADTVLYSIRLSSFRPYLVEAVFGQGDLPAIELTLHNGDKLRLIGKVDRVDKYKDYFIIIDYKTGIIKDIDNELHYGSKIQLPIYLNALSRDGFIPAGAFYLSLTDKFVKENSSAQYYSGIVREDLANALDNSIDLRAGNVGTLIKLKYNKGKLSGKALISEEHLKNMLTYSKQIAEQGVIEIIKGYIEAKPNESACGYCDYKDVCYAKLRRPLLRKYPSVKGTPIVQETSNEQAD